MRQIKFRAWNGRRMYDVERIDFFDKFTAVFEDIEGLHNSGKDIIMQYTGLEDKNGKEIFEGDILKSGNTIGIIIWNEGGFYLKRLISNNINVSNSTLSNLSKNGMTFYKVIGNVFENPNLLNNK